MNQQNQTKQESSYEHVKRWLETPAMHDVIAQSLPTGSNVGAWIGAALAYVRTSQDVQRCEPLSITGAIITIASFGLRLDGVMGHAYIRGMPIKDKNGNVLRYEAQVQLGYKGMIELVYRNPDIQDVEPVIVYDGDTFEFQKGTNPFLHHTWPLQKDRGEMIAVYAGLRFKNGYFAFQIHNVQDIMSLREKILLQSWIKIERTQSGFVYFKKPWNQDWKRMSENQANQYPWIGHLTPMILKTAIRWSQKFWPTVGTDFARAANLVELDDEGLSQGMADLAAERMTDDMKQQAELLPAYTPDEGNHTTVRSRAKNDRLKKQMLAQATSENDTHGGMSEEEIKEAMERERAEWEAEQTKQAQSGDDDPF